MSVDDSLRVEVAYVDARKQFLRELDLPAGSTVIDAIAASDVVSECGLRLGALDIGIWSKPVSAETVLETGDRVEIYRPLRIDPKQARRQRVRRGK